MDNKNKMAKALSELADEMNSFSELSGEIRDLKEVITDSNEELIATFVEGTKRILKKETKDNTRDIKSLESSVVESLNSLKRGIAEVERGVKAIKLPSNTDFRATGAMLKLPIKELTRTIEGFNLSKKPEDAIPVRLSDGENFYKALDQIVQYTSGGGGTSYAFDTQQSSPTKAATVAVTVGGKSRDVIAIVNPDGSTISSGGGLGISTYDYVSVGYPDSDTEIYTFKSGGSGGTTVSTVTVEYTNSTKEFVSTVTKT